MDALDRLRELPEEERAEWLRANKASLDAAELSAIADYFNAMGTSRDVVEIAREQADRQDPIDRQEASDAETASSIDARADQLEDAGMSRFDASTQARAEAGVARGDPADPFGDTLLPYELVQLLGEDAKDEQAVEDLLTFVNDSTNRTFATVEEAFGAGVFADPIVQAASRVLVAPEEPEDGFLVNTVKGQERVAITATEATQAMNIWGLRPHELDRTIKIADLYGFENMDGGVAWQPMAAMFAAAGFAGYGQTADQDRQLKADKDKLAVEIQRMKDSLKGMGSTGEGYAAIQKQIAEAQGRYNELTQQYTDNVVQQPTSAKNPLYTPQYLRQQYMAGIEQYEGDDRLALVHVFDPALASRIRLSDGDPSKLDWRDAEKLGSLTRSAGFTSLDEFAGTMVAFGMGEAGGDDMMSQLLKSLQAKLASLSGGGGGGRIVMKPDPVAIRQATKDMYRQLYMEDPSDDDLNSMAARVEAAISGAPMDQSVDGNARVRDVVESNPKYETYYGKRPDGMSEQDYQAMMVAGQRSMLGNEAAGNVAARSGMRSGQYQTAVGATAGLKEAWDNSTFLGRLAQAAETVTRNT